jgi:predicted transcriptional regulator
MDSIGLRIKHLRDLRFDGNNVKMASELGTSEANIRNFINGSLPKIEFVIAICEKLEINYEWMLTGKGEMIDENKKPSNTNSVDGLKERYISLLERTVASLEKKIADLSKTES